MKYYIITFILLLIILFIFQKENLIEKNAKLHILRGEPKFNKVKNPIEFIGYKKEDKFYYDYLLFKYN